MIGMKNSLLIILGAISFVLLSCKKQCYECRNTCYTCPHVPFIVCSDAYPTKKDFELFLAIQDSLHIPCIQDRPTKSVDICNDDQKYALEQIFYTCNAK